MNHTIHTSSARLLSCLALVVVAGCGASTSAASTSGGAGSGTTSSGSATVMASKVGSHGTVLVAASNHMTLYQFAQDTAGSGTSACTGACIARWPALTMSAGSTPSAGAGVSGQLATISRPDGGGTQVTYNGRPLYFFSGDSKSGDANGNYPGWAVVPVSASSGSGGAPSSSAPSYNY